MELPIILVFICIKYLWRETYFVFWVILIFIVVVLVIRSLVNGIA